MTVESSAAPDRPDPAPSPTPDGLDWIARLPSAAAPGFIYLAGACRGIAVGGGGQSLAEAAARLAGEAAEVMAQTAAPLPCADPADPAIDALWTAAGAPLRVAARRSADEGPVGVPAAAIFLSGPAAAERRASAPPASLGLAAAPDPAAARLAGLLELIERDAAAAWWCADARPRQLDLAALAGAAAGLAGLRAGAAEPRATTLIALPAAADVPVVCALSREAAGGGLAFGLKAALDPDAAAAGAVIELLQMELALELARHRAARGTSGPGDRGPLARAALPGDHPAFAALPALAPARAPERDFEGLATRLAAGGVIVTVADLPQRPGGLAVAKVFAPGLRPLPGGPGDPRAGTPGAAAPLM